MTSSILEQYWIQQKQQQSLSITNRSDVFASPSNLTIREFCPEEKEEKNNSSLLRRLAAGPCCNNCKTFTIGLVIGSLLGAIALATVVTMSTKSHPTTVTTTTTSTSTSSTSSTSTTSTTTTTSTTSSSSSSSSTSSTSSTSETTTTTASTTTTTTNVCLRGDVLLTFDDLAASIAISNGYQNFDWTYAYTYTTSTNTSGYYTAIVSPPNNVFNAFAYPLIMQSTFNCNFTLHSIAAAAAWDDDLQLTVVGYNSNAVIINNTFTLQVFSLSNITFSGYSNLNKLIFSTSGGTKDPNVASTGKQFAMDNVFVSFP